MISGADNQPVVMITASALARRWGRSVRWVRDNIIKPRAMTVYRIGERNYAVSITDVRIMEKRAKVSAVPAARDRLIHAMAGAARLPRRGVGGRFECKQHGGLET